MNSLDDSHSQAADAPAPAPAGGPLGVFHYHPAFCQLALPVRAPAGGSWSRDIGTAAVTIEAREGGAEGASPIPTGKYLRLLLMYLCSLARRSEGPVIEVGASAAAMAAAMGLDAAGPKLRELGEQYERLTAAKVTVALAGKPPLSVFDARGKARPPGEWRGSVKLNARFLDSLTAQAVALDAATVLGLMESSLALDTYAWLTSLRPSVLESGAVPVTWEDLMARLGSANAKVEEFKASFDANLQQVSQACPELALVIRAEGIEVRPSEREKRRASRGLAAAAPAELGEVAVARPAAAPVAAPVAARPIEIAPAAAAPAPVVERVSVPPAVRAVASAEIVAAEPAPMERSSAQGRRGLGERIALKHHLTGLSQVVWLQRSQGRDDVLLEVTPGGRYDPENLTVLALEPIVVQIAGGLYQRDFERVGAWANVNRDLIDDFWEGDMEDEEAVLARVKKVPGPGWR